MNRLLAALVLFVGLAPCARAAAITAGQNITSASAGSLRPAGPGAYSGNLVNEAGLAYSNTFLLDMAQYGALEVSAQTIFSTVTYTSPTFSDGSKSTGNITVVNYLGLSAAKATNKLTVTANTWPLGSVINVNGTSLRGGIEWAKGNVSSNTATNIAAAINALADFDANAVGSVIYTTAAVVGSAGNTYFLISNTSSITVNALKFGGGQDNAVLTINGTSLTQGTQWSAETSNGVTALNIAAAIGTAFTTLVSTNGVAKSAIVYATSTLNGSVYNYSMVSSTQNSLSVSGALMTGGTAPGDVLGSKVFTAAGTFGLPLALPVLYAVGSNPAIGGLTTGTTYFAVPLGGNTFSLAKYSSSAVAGLSADFVTVAASTASGTTANTYTLAPLAWAGSATYLWQTSNDNSNWSTAPSTGTVTITSTSAGSPLSINWGVLGYRYLRLNFTAPTSGGLAIQVPVYLKQD